MHFLLASFFLIQQIPLNPANLLVASLATLPVCKTQCGWIAHRQAPNSKIEKIAKPNGQFLLAISLTRRFESNNFTFKLTTGNNRKKVTNYGTIKAMMLKAPFKSAKLFT